MTAWYAVSSVPTIEAPVGEMSSPVEGASLPADAGDPSVTVRVDAAADGTPLARPWRPLVGSEHLALLLRGPGPGGRHVGDELAESFRIARRELGAEGVRAHAILHDVLGVYREVDGEPRHDFTKVDAVLDRLLETGLRPVMELSYMPRDLASDPDRTVFDYRGIISPPRDLGRWEALVEALVRHLDDRYGTAEVARWPFEVWNEPNLSVFWSGTESDVLRAVRRHRARREAREPLVPRRGTIDRGGRLGRRPPRARPRGRRPGRLPQHPHVRDGTAGPATDRRPLRRTRPAAAVDRVGHLADPQRPGQRQRLGSAARGPRDALGGGPARTRSRTG